MRTRAKNPHGIWPIPVHCNDRDKEKRQPEYPSTHPKERMQKQGVTLVLSCLGCLQTLLNALLILESILCFRQQRQYGSDSMCVNLLSVNRTASLKDGIIQETLYEKCPVLPLKPPVLIQLEEPKMESCLKIGNRLWEWIFEPTGAQSKSGWRKEVSLNV